MSPFLTTVIVSFRFLAVIIPGLASLTLRYYRPRSSTSEPPPPRPGKVVRSSRVPLMANLATIGVFILLFFPTINPMTFYRGQRDVVWLVWAIIGLALVLIGTAIVFRARGVLGASWSFAPKASRATGLTTTDLYAFVRHPIYFGMLLWFIGIGAAFTNIPAVVETVLLILPTLCWRAKVEEQLLTRVFGDPYVEYRRRTKMIVPYLL